jgi:hypothetical protein
MRDPLPARLIDLPTETQTCTANRPFERLTVLAARRTASLLQDAALTSLFHSYRMELFERPSDLFVARATSISYVLLCASAGLPLLAAEAHIVRRQWPLAKIIALEPVPHEFEDHLYDDIVAANCSVATLAAAFSSHSVDQLDQKMSWSSGTSQPPRTPYESDPTKTGPSGRLQPSLAKPRDVPAGERPDLGRRLVA